MKKLINYTNLFLGFFFGLLYLSFFLGAKSVSAGDEACGAGQMCYAQRVINQWSCHNCTSWQWQCNGDGRPCAGSNNCIGHGGSCIQVCTSYGGSRNPCRGPFNQYVSCNRSPGHCEWDGRINDCGWNGNQCVNSGYDDVFGCCGPGGSTPTPPPPSCTCTGWSDQGCGNGGCSATDMYQTRTCSPSGCNSESRCDANACPPPTCSCTGWVAGACGGSGADVACLSYQRFYSQTCVDSNGIPNCDPAGACCTADEKCQDDPTCVGAPSCSINIPIVVINAIGATTNPDPIVQINSEQNGSIDYVTFSVTDTSIANITATYSNPDTNPAYNVELQAVNFGSTSYTAIATMDDGITTCQALASVTVAPSATAWFQAMRGDIIAVGNISTTIPTAYCILPACDPSLITYTTGQGTPGIAAAGGTITPINNVSQPDPPYNWAIQNDPYQGTIFNYAYFENKTSTITFNSLGSSITTSSQLTSLPTYQGYVWAKRTGDLTISTNNIDIGNSKVVLFVNGNLNIQSNVNVGQGFFIAVVSGNINVASNVGGTADGAPELEGLYFANGSFNSPTAGSGADVQLHVRGAVAVGGYSLGRTLFDNTQTPAELFEFGADQLLQLPSALSKKEVVWREVAP